MLQDIRTSVRAWVRDPFDRADHPWITVRKPVKWGCALLWCAVWLFCTVFSIIWAVGPAGAPQRATSPEEAHPDGVDNWYGIMWWGKGDMLHPVINNITGLGMGPSAFFDPTKPTMIYSHGYQPGSGPTAHRERLTSFEGVHMADAWIDQGWNVGSFYWTQFADDSTVELAESKIWPSCLPVTGICDAPTMRWMNKDGTFVDPAPNAIPSVSDLMYEAIVASTAGALPDQGFKLRIAGHSLGGGVVVGAGYKLAAAADAGVIPSHLKPERVSMLDPFWTPAHDRDVLPRMYRTRHVHNVTIDMSRTSAFSAPASFREQLQTLPSSHMSAAFVWQDAKYISNDYGILTGATAGSAKHSSAKAFYFLSIDPKNPNKEKGPSATTGDRVLLDFAVSGYYWKQTGGFYTETILDDTYEKLSWKDDPLPLSTDAKGLLTAWALVVGLAMCLTASCALCLCTWCMGRYRRGRGGGGEGGGGGGGDYFVEVS